MDCFLFCVWRGFVSPCLPLTHGQVTRGHQCPLLTTDPRPRCLVCPGPWCRMAHLMSVGTCYPGAAPLSKLAWSSWPHLIQTTGFGLLSGKLLPSLWTLNYNRIILKRLKLSTSTHKKELVFYHLNMKWTFICKIGLQSRFNNFIQPFDSPAVGDCALLSPVMLLVTAPG